MGRRFAATIALALALLASAGGSRATPTVNVWTSHGPPGPQILALAASPAAPGIVYAASEDRIWRSADSGEIWSSTGDGPTNLSYSLAADPADADSVIAGSWDGSLWVTSDGGEHWSPPSSGFSGSSWPLLSWSSAGLYALVDGMLYASVDRGQDWTAAGSPSSGGARSLLVVSPTAIYVGNELGTVEFSEDGGATWSDRSQGLPPETEPGSGYPPSIERLAADPSDPQTLYAEASPLGVFRSADAGANWVEIETPAPGHVLERVATLATTPTTVLATVGGDVVRSTDEGESWTAATESPKSIGSGAVSSLFADPTNPTTVYVGGFGVYRSTDAGDTFSFVSEGLGNGDVNALAAVPETSGSYLAATWEGAFRTDDDGSTWEHASQGMRGQAMDLAADPTNPEKFYLIAAGDLWVTSDGAAHWQPASLAVEGVAYSVAADADHVYVGASTTIYRSANGGESWEASPLPLVNDIVNDVSIDPSDGQRAYAGTSDGLFRSADGGATWAKIDARFISEVSVGGDGAVYALANGAVVAFTPGGAGVPVASIGLSTYAYSLQADPADADTVYAGTPQGVYQTADGGQHWAKLPTAGMESQFVSDIVTRTPHRLVVATSRGTAWIDLGPPTASVDPATNLTATSADLTGAANPNGSNATAFFEYGTTDSYGTDTALIPLGAGSEPVPVAASLSGLTHATLYHYRLVVQSSGGIAASADATFTSDFLAPTASTSAATSLTASGATLPGTVNPRGGATSYWFEYGPDQLYGQSTSEADAGSGVTNVTVSSILSGLDPLTTYHYRIVAENAKGTVAGADRQFTTSAVPPTVTSVSPLTISEGSLEGDAVRLHASWSASPGTNPICIYHVQRGSDAEPPTSVGAFTEEAADAPAFPGTGVYFQVRAADCDGTHGEYIASPTVNLRLLQENAPNVDRSRGWFRTASLNASGGYVLRTTTPGSSVTFTFTGRSFAWAAPKGARYAAASVRADGGPRTVVSLYRDIRSEQNLVYIVDFDSVAKHRIVITARAAGARRRVDIDAFAVLR